MADGARTLVQHLLRIATEDSVEGLDPALQTALQPVARKLVQEGHNGDIEHLKALESSPEMAAWTAAASLRSLDVVEFWQPLLKHCLTGSSTAPVADLKSASEEARALMEVVSARPAGEMRDKVLRLATEAAARVEKWIPAERKKSKGSGPKATRFRRGTFMGEDEDGNPIERAPIPRRVKREKPASRFRSFVGWTFTLLLVAAMAAGVVWFAMTQNKVEPMATEHYSALVKQVEGKAVEGRELVLTLAPAWVRKRPEHREADLRLLFVSGEREGATSIRAQTASGELLARIPVEGPLEWGELSLVADQARVDAEAEADAALERGELPVKIGADGKLERPLTAEELTQMSKEAGQE